MWDKQFERARWNGIEFNILRTVFDGGKRLQVVELPYNDDPSIWVIGGKAKSYQMDAVFVGASSLEEANAFNAALDADPVGNLEHPYLGELDLVYQSSAISFSTKKGLVTLSLKFIKQGAIVEIPTTTESIDTITKSIVEHSATGFTTDVSKADATEIETIKYEYKSVLDKFRFIADQINISDIDLTRLKSQIDSALNNIVSLKNNPKPFAEQINTTTFTLISEIKNSDRGLNLTSKQINSIEKNSTNNHIRMLTTIIAIETNPFIQLGITALKTAEIFTAESNLTSLIYRVKQRLTESTTESTYEKYDLVYAIELLTAELFKYQDKIKIAKNRIKETEIYSPVTALSLAHKLECQYEAFDGLNDLGHPLFVTGKVMYQYE